MHVRTLIVKMVPLGNVYLLLIKYENNMSKVVYRLSQLQGSFIPGGGQMPLISCSMWHSVDLWSCMKIKSDLIKSTPVSVHNTILKI